MLHVGQLSIVNEKLVATKKVIPPALHLKLGCFSNLVKSMEDGSPPRLYLKQKFAHKTEAKIKQGSLKGPEIRKLMNDQEFGSTLNANQFSAWNAFRKLCKGFFGSNKKS